MGVRGGGGKGGPPGKGGPVDFRKIFGHSYNTF